MKLLSALLLLLALNLAAPAFGCDDEKKDDQEPPPQGQTK
jgi:hypothetical protein